MMALSAHQCRELAEHHRSLTEDSVSFGCLTQYAIGAGPVMFGAGYVTQGEWWRIGFVMSIIYLAIWLLIGPLWWMVLGHV
jgi:di/tricarboxylate transporter